MTDELRHKRPFSVLIFWYIYSWTLTSFLHLVYFKSTSFNHDHQDSCRFCCLAQIYQPYRGLNNNNPNLQARIPAAAQACGHLPPPLKGGDERRSWIAWLAAPIHARFFPYVFWGEKCDCLQATALRESKQRAQLPAPTSVRLSRRGRKIGLET